MYVFEIPIFRIQVNLIKHASNLIFSGYKNFRIIEFWPDDQNERDKKRRAGRPAPSTKKNMNTQIYIIVGESVLVELSQSILLSSLFIVNWWASLPSHRLFSGHGSG